MAKLIIVEGPDNSGKSTFIKHLLHHTSRNNVRFLQFPKKNSEGKRFEIASANEMAAFESMLGHLDPSVCYILDRSYLSNMVYETLRGEPDAWKKRTQDLARLLRHNGVFILPLTRAEIAVDFQDDLISLDHGSFNEVIQLYNTCYEELGIKPIEILKMSPENKPIESMAFWDIMRESGLENFISEFINDSL